MDIGFIYIWYIILINIVVYTVLEGVVVTRCGAVILGSRLYNVFQATLIGGFRGMDPTGLWVRR